VAGTAVIGAVALASVGLMQEPAQDTRADERRRERFTVTGGPESAEAATATTTTATTTSSPTNAPTGFDNRTNGMDPQGPPFDSLNEDNVVPLRSFNDNRFIFEETETIADGLGPTYNAQSCRECHQNVVTGGASQIAEHRTGHMLNGQFFESLGGSLVHSRATHQNIVEVVRSRMTSGRSGSRPTRSGPGSSKRSPTARCSVSGIVSLRRCAGRR